MKYLKRFLLFIVRTFFSSLGVTGGLILLLAAQVIWGTLLQADHGLYWTQKYLFSAWFVVLPHGFILPGVRCVLFLIILQMIGYFSKLRLSKSYRTLGIWITHLGILSLLLSGFVMSLVGFESQVTLFEGQKTTMSQSYTDFEWVIYHQEGSENACYLMDNHPFIAEKYHQVPKHEGVSLEVLQYYPSVRISAFNGQIEMEPQKIQADATQNIPGALLQIRYGNQSTTVHCIGDGVAQDIPGTDHWKIQLRHKRFILPISIELEDVIKDDYVNTERARAYCSHVKIWEHNHLRENVKIWMNHPYLIGDWVFYQAGYQRQGLREYTTLAVVYNPWRYLPYGASVFIVLGMLIQFLIRLADVLKLRFNKRSS